MTEPDRRDLGRLFNEVPELYDRVRPAYPDELFADLAAITGMDSRSSVLEVGCGTGQATRSLAGLGYSVTCIEPGAGMAALARKRLAAFGNVEIENSAFEEWHDGGRRFDVLVAVRRHGIGDSTRPIDAGAGPMTCSAPGGGWRCSATLLSAGRVSLRCTRRPPICTSDFRPATPAGVIRRSRTRCG